MDDGEVESDDFGSRRAGFVAPEALRGIVTRCTKLASLRFFDIGTPVRQQVRFLLLSW